MQIFGRNTHSQTYLDELAIDNKIKIGIKKNSRYNIDYFELTYKLELIKEKLNKWFSALNKAVE